MTFVSVAAASESFSVDDLSPSDEKAWAECFEGYCDFYRSPYTADLGSRVFALLMDPEANLQCVVARNSAGRVVAIAHFRSAPSSLDGRNTTFLDDLFTLPELRGRHIGRALISEVARRAAAKGELPLQWITGEDNTAAQALYDKIACRTDWVPYLIRFDDPELLGTQKALAGEMPFSTLPEGYSMFSSEDLRTEDMASWKEAFSKYAIFYACPVTEEILATTFGWLMDASSAVRGLFVRNSSGRIVAFAHFRSRLRSMSGGQVCYLDDLFVDESCRRRGFAETLLLAMYNHCLKKSWPRAHWITASKNSSARRVYERCGASRQKYILYEIKEQQ
jgi:ribosomal protein S18 acetylase RimI-like enzyme